MNGLMELRITNQDTHMDTNHKEHTRAPSPSPNLYQNCEKSSRKEVLINFVLIVQRHDFHAVFRHSKQSFKTVKQSNS